MRIPPAIALLLAATLLAAAPLVSADGEVQLPDASLCTREVVREATSKDDELCVESIYGRQDAGDPCRRRSLAVFAAATATHACMMLACMCHSVLLTAWLARYTQHRCAGRFNQRAATVHACALSKPILPPTSTHPLTAVEPCCAILADYYGPNSTRATRHCFCVESYWTSLMKLAEVARLEWADYFDGCT
jgi:hypothetical protein